MIQSIQLTNFKCFEHQDVALRPLTLLAGLNSSGKSTIIQALLLLRQSFLENLLPNTGLTLNGKLAQLGTAKDVLFEESDVDEIGFELKDDLPASLRLRLAYREDAYREESDVLALSGSGSTGEIWRTSLFQDEFQYLRAERIGPRTSFGMSDYEVRHHRQIGSSGEFAAHFLALFGSETVELQGLRHPAATANTLQSQVEAWMTEISPGVRLTLKRYSEMDLMTFSVSYSLGHQVASSAYRPTNVGFGITYALPIVVSVLSARPGSLVIIENPEAHLHPRGQVRMGELLCQASAAGIQVLIETHSDHVLNGIRLAVQGRKAAASDVALYHCRWEVGGKSPSLTLLTMDENGRLPEWPEGFFDEIERSLDRLLGGE
jgi:predicted ATPase